MRFSPIALFSLLILLGLSSGLRGQSPTCLLSWCEIETVQNGWCYSSELGWFYEELCPWVFINDKGWFYSDGPDTPDGEQWIYNSTNGWFWTSISTFPFLWSNNLEDWIVYSDLALTQGAVLSGAVAVTPLPDSIVNIYRATGLDEPTLLTTLTSDENGGVVFTTPLETEGGIYYITADVTTQVKLVSALGGSVPQYATVNELTTVATAFAFSNFFTASEDIRGELLGLQIAAGMTANLVNRETGGPSTVLLSSPNADQTNSLRSVRNLSNLIATCISSLANCNALFALTTPSEGSAPNNTLEALLNIARNPADSVDGIFSLSQTSTLYQPTLVLPPDAWTLTVKINNTGSAVVPFGGTANTVFDERGYAWINNNTVQGQSISSNSIVILKPDGSPSDGTNGTPLSPIDMKGGLLGPGFGMARSKIDRSIWVGNFGWGGLNPGPVSEGGTGTGSVSQFAADGTAISTSDGYDGGTDRVQGIIVDDSGNVWTANFGNNTIVVFLEGDPDRALSAELDCKPFGLAFTPDGTVWASTVGSAGLPGEPSTCSSPSNVTHWRINDDQSALERLSYLEIGKDLKGLDIDLDGYVWVASGGDDTVYRVAPDGMSAVGYQGGGISSPWSIRIDDAGEVWVANFGPMDVLPAKQVYRNSAVSKLAGPNSITGLPVGTPLTPSTGYTMPSAGSPVLLSDGTPLNQTGNPAQPAFVPLMRSVSAVPDRAGNLWVSNNWKPNFLSDLNGDPGGDGMVIFIGIAAPTEPGRTQ